MVEPQSLEKIEPKFQKTYVWDLWSLRWCYSLNLWHLFWNLTKTKFEDLHFLNLNLQWFYGICSLKFSGSVLFFLEKILEEDYFFVNQ